jgi:Domain of unknown function (DUF4184)
MERTLVVIKQRYTFALSVSLHRHPMPFTLAHPAAIIPLQRFRFLALLPLIVGSVVPDVLSFAPFRFRWLLPDTHTLSGLPTVDLALGYCILIVIVIIRRQLIAPLWGSHRVLVQTAFDRFLAQRFCWLNALPALLLGTFTHLLWDNFTHADRWMVRTLPVLQESLFPASDHPVQFFHALQYISSVIGLLFIAWCYRQALQNVHSVARPEQTSAQQKHRYLLLAMIGLSILAGGIFASGLPHQFISTYTFLAVSLRVTMMCFAFLYVWAGAIIAFKERPTREDTVG